MIQIFYNFDQNNPEMHMQTYGLDSGLILVEDESYENTISVEGKVFHLKIQPIWEWLLS